MLIHLTPVGVSGILGAWSGQLFQGRSGNFANALRMRRHALNIWLRADGQSIKQFLAQNVEKRSSIRTDGWRGYSKSALSAYNHDQTPGMRASHIHRAFGNLKTWLNGTHHGVNPKYLQNYLDEFVFRFNRRKTPMAAFQTLLGLTSARSPIYYEELIQREPTG